MSEVLQRIKKLERRLPQTMHADGYALRRELFRFRKKYKTASLTGETEQTLLRLEKQLDRAVQKKQNRRRHRPELNFNAELPIVARKQEIIEAVRRHRVVIISGETGSGKTTQIPKLCLAAGRGLDGRIGCTQPRRIAAVTVARRIAEELNEELGRSVGYKIRFRDQTAEDAYVKIMTDGILLAETQRDPYLNEYDTLIIDEAHERSLNIDFILGFLKNLLVKRKNLKLIITSATIDTEKFSRAFGDAPIIEVSGRMFPVEVRYFPLASVQSSATDAAADDNDEISHVELAVRAFERLQAESRRGDVLIFMPTEQGIRETCELIEGRGYPDVHVLPLFARLAGAEQSKIFSALPGRKVIVSTNIAETSITIPGIKYVIDSGLARVPQYMPRSRTTALPVVPISRSSADQRKGRCGRVENGICIRLYTEEEYDNRPFFTVPEILRANLAEVILRMIALKLGDIEEFPFIDRPVPKSIKDGFDILLELGAIVPVTGARKGRSGGNYMLSRKGRIMARIPVDPRLSRMLIEARKEGCLEEILIVISALSIQDPRDRPADKAQAADQKHGAFKDPYSDFITLLNIWESYHKKLKREKKTGRMKAFCRENFLSFKRMREWRDIHVQLSLTIKECGLKTEQAAAGRKKSPDGSKSEDAVFSPLYIAIHKSILSGYLSNIAVRKDKNFFRATKGRDVMIFPGSGLFNKAHNWIVAAEMVETSQLFARTVANIDSRWLEDVGRLHCKSTYSDPHWEKKRGEVVAYEQVTLFGLVIVSRRPVSYGKINPEEAEEIFIRSALVEGDVAAPFAFMQHNQKLIEDVQQVEDKIRKRDLLISEEDIFLFYRERLAGISDIRTFARYLKDKGDDGFLRMTRDDLLRYEPDQGTLSLFPDRLDVSGYRLECDYQFDPGHQTDGVTVKIPSSVASSVPSEPLEWLVPGLFKDKIAALVKALPKEYRKKLVPVASNVAVIAREMPQTQTSLVTALSEFIYRRFGVNIPASAWPTEALPDHLKMRISITGPDGQELESGRDAAILNQDVADQADIDGFKAAREKYEKSHLTQWDFGEVEAERIIEGRNRVKWSVYPGLCKETDGIALRLFKDREKALSSHKDGVAALFGIYFTKKLKLLKKDLRLPGALKELANYFGGCKTFEKRLYDNVCRDLFHRNFRSAVEFHAHAEAISPLIYRKGQDILEKSNRVLEAYHKARSTIFRLETSGRNNPVTVDFFQRLRKDLDQLVPENFMALYDADRLVHIERYVNAIAIRAERGFSSFDKDQQKAVEIEHCTARLGHLLKDLSKNASSAKRERIEEFFWLIEEYKVSLFAQELKTPVRVSRKRLDKMYSEIQRMV